MASRTPKPFSLRLVLIVPYVVLVIALAVALGVLSYSAGSRAVATVSEHLLIEAVSRITQAVDRHIVGSGAVLESAFPDGMAAPRSIEADFHELRTRLWIATTLHTDPNDYVYYGNEAGQALGLYRRSAGVAELRMKLKEDEKRAIYSFEGIDGPLQFERRETRLFDPRTRPWYADGRKAAGHTWTSVYIDFGSRQLVATRARQVRSASGAFEGVVATDVSLRALNEFVGRLEVSHNGVAFIIEPDGNLIASSASPNVVTLADGSSGRLNAASSEHPLVKAAYVTVRDQLALRDQTQQPQAFSFDNENGHLVQAAFDRIRDDAGLDWVMVVAMPASDFLGNVTENVTRSIVLAGLAVLIVIVIGLSILGWVSRDLRRLSEVARRVGHGELDAPVGIHRQDEIGELARSFEAMQQHLRTAWPIATPCCSSCAGASSAPARTGARRRWRCCSSTSTALSRSTTATATTPATSPCRRSPSACAPACAPKTPSRAMPVTSSSSSSIGSPIARRSSRSGATSTPCCAGRSIRWRRTTASPAPVAPLARRSTPTTARTPTPCSSTPTARCTRTSSATPGPTPADPAASCPQASCIGGGRSCG